MRLLIKRILIALQLSILSTGAFAQASGTRVVTLQEATLLALEHNVAVKNEQLEIGIAKAQVGETLAQGLPQLNASGNFTYNIERQTNFLPGAFMGVSGFIPVQFGTPYLSSGSATLSQLIFDGSYFVGLQASKVYKNLAEKSLEMAKEDVAEGVALAYYGALVAEERLELLAANVQRLDTLYNETRIMNEQGFAEAIDVQRIKVNLNNVRTDYENVKRGLDLNLSMLKIQIGIPIKEKIEIAETIEDFNINELVVSENFSYLDRVDYQLLQVNKELSSLDIKGTKMEYLPRLSAFANIGINAGKETFGELFEPTILEETDGNGNIISEKVVNTWNPYSAVGLNLDIPIFDGFLKKNTIRRKKLVAEQLENQIKGMENAIDLEVQETQVSFHNSLKTLESQMENRELAEEVYKVAKIKYQEGVGSNLEVLEAENSFKESETNYFNALYNALVARVAYQKATGTLLNNQ